MVLTFRENIVIKRKKPKIPKCIETFKNIELKIYKKIFAGVFEVSKLTSKMKYEYKVA